MIFRDRRDAGERLAELLAEYAGRGDVLMLSLPVRPLVRGWSAARA